MISLHDCSVIQALRHAWQRSFSRHRRTGVRSAVLLASLVTFSCATDESIIPRVTVAPVVTGTTVRALSSRSVEVTGRVRPNDHTVQCFIEYGSDLSYGQRSRNFTLPPDTATRTLTDTISNLLPGRYIHFRLSALYASGTSTGPDAAVTMPADTAAYTAPEVLETSVKTISPNAAVVTGLARANKRDAICHVEYGTGQLFDHRSADMPLAADTAAHTMTFGITGLIPGTRVSFRVVASSTEGTAIGPTANALMPTDPGAIVEFTLPLAVGTEWTYDYVYQWHAKDYEFKNITGVHTWRLLSADTTSLPRMYGFVAHKVDSVWYRVRNGQTGGYIDTSYHVVTDLPFTAKVTLDSIVIQWQGTIAQGTIPVDHILRYVESGTSTQRLKGVSGGAINYDALFEQGKGLVSYASSISVMSGAYTIAFTLSSLKKP